MHLWKNSFFNRIKSEYFKKVFSFEIDIKFEYIDNITEYKEGQLSDWLKSYQAYGFKESLILARDKNLEIIGGLGYQPRKEVPYGKEIMGNGSGYILLITG